VEEGVGGVARKAAAGVRGHGGIGNGLVEVYYH